ncbi:unnamed protein product [Caenorhabditis angaria]|uniref:RRM domain-containing protein n=1 Tax=Caenorhabditis angaria TaxID=860376 RepID=A0A9P1J4U5_9PELO|nr:unnamed protein product [Caenorhabditis angaria]
MEVYSKGIQDFLIQNKAGILSFFDALEKENSRNENNNKIDTKKCGGGKLRMNQNATRSRFKLTTKPSRVVGVFGLGQFTDEKDLLNIFQEFGKVEKINIIRDRYNQRSRGFGFVYLRTKEEAQNAIRSLANFVIDGHKVRIDFSNTV